MNAVSKVDLGSGLVFVGTFALLYYVIRRRSNTFDGKQLPPCLPTVPFLGSMPFLDKLENLHVFLKNKALDVGDIFILHLAKYRVLVLNGKRAIHEALVKKSTDFASRPALPNARLFNTKMSGIVERKFDSDFRRYHQLCLSILKQFGFGSCAIMETRIQVEVEDLIKKLKDLGAENPIHPEDLVTKSVLNVIASIVFGSRYPDDDPEVDQLIMITQKFIRKSLDTNLLNFFPFLIHLPRFKNLINENFDLNVKLTNMFEQKITAGCKEDATDSFIRSYIEQEGPDYDHAQLIYVIRDLIFAGTETSSTTLLWAFVMLANRQDVQDRLVQEIDSVVPRSRLPSIEDRIKLRYVEATILELMRWKTIVPMALPHLTTCDTEVDGYFIPADTIVFVNLYSAHMDSRVWKDPEEFNPERFLDESGNVINKEQMIAFSVGRRSCLGELLARQEVYLFFTSLVQQFRIVPPKGVDKLDVEDKVGVSLSPSHYTVRFIPRQ